MTFVKVCTMDIVPQGSIKSFRINQKEVMVINRNGQIFCLQARCTHAGAPLKEGSVSNGVLTCPWHGSKFKITSGEVVNGPATEALQVYKYSIENNFLYVDLE